MSQNLQEVFKRVQRRKAELKEIKKIYKNALLVSPDYQKVLEEIEALKINKKKIEAAIQADFKAEFDKLETIKINNSSDNQLLSDIAIIEVIKGEKITVTDDNEMRYDPLFTVKFKKQY